ERGRGGEVHRTPCAVRHGRGICVGDGRGGKMTVRIQRVDDIHPPASAPRYELRTRNHGPGDAELEIWQLPSPATPHRTSPARLAGLRGRNLELVEHRVLRRLSRSGVRLGHRQDGATHGYAIGEDDALILGLLFRTLAPMRSRDNMRAVAEGIEAMGRE